MTEALIAFPGIRDPLRPDVAAWRRDWICEILSPNNAINDTIKKKRIYHRAQVGHFWIIDPIAETLQVYRWDQAGYLEVLVAERTDRIRAEPFDADEIGVAALFGDEDDENED